MEKVIFTAEQTATKRIWLLNTPNDSLIESYKEYYPNVSYSILNFLANRNIDIKDINSFLNPTLKDTFPNPLSITDMEKGVDRLILAIKNNEKITILADYDVDGATSASTLYNFLSSINVSPEIYIPDRHKEGYGVNKNAILKITENASKLLILLDNGSLSHSEIDYATELGLDTIIIDHHSIEDSMPHALASINPNRKDDKSKQNHLSTAGLVFLFIVVLNKKLIEEGYTPTNPMSLLDLTALGTICDMVPLKGVNRAFVTQGIKVFLNTNNVGLKAMCEVCEIKDEITIDTLGFMFGPILNAGSRIGDSDTACNLLIEKDPKKALKIANHLKELNEKRKKLEQELISQAIMIQEKELETSENEVILIGGETYEKGVVGLIANKLKDTFHKPSCVYNLDARTGLATASGRSIDSVNLGEIILDLMGEGLIEKGGGHKMAVGFSFKIENKEKLISFFNKKIKEHKLNGHKEANIIIDSPLPLSAINEDFINNFKTLEPFGMDFREPVFVVSNVRVSFFKWVGKQENHLYLVLKDESGGQINAFCYKCHNSELAKYLTSSANKMSIVINLRLNKYLGKTTVQGIIIDATNN